MKFLVFVCALLTGLVASAADEEAVNQTTTSTNRASTVKPAQPPHGFYVTQPWPVISRETLQDIKNLVKDIKLLPGKLENGTAAAAGQLWRHYVADPAQEGKRLVVRYFDVASPFEIYQATGILPDDVWKFRIKPFALPAELQSNFATGQKYTAQLQVKIKRASGKKIPGLRTRQIGIAQELIVAEMEGGDGSTLLKYLAGPPSKASAGPATAVPNSTTDLVFRVGGADLYEALKDLRYNPRKYDTFYLSLAIVTNQKNRYIYDLVEIDLKRTLVKSEKVVQGMGRPDPVLMAFHAQNRQNDRQDRTFLAALNSRYGDQAKNLQAIENQLTNSIASLNASIGALHGQIATAEQAINQLSQTNNSPEVADRLTKIEQLLQDLTARLAEYENKAQEITQEITPEIPQDLPSLEPKISPIPPEDDEE